MNNRKSRAIQSYWNNEKEYEISETSNKIYEDTEATCKTGNTNLT